MKRGGVLSTLGIAEEAGEEVLEKGGSALKAAVTGFFVAAGDRPGVLFGPVSLLVAGLGEGARAYDGRVRQPGLGGKRPRGFLPEEDVPVAATVAVPHSIAALALACAYASGASILSCVRPGIAAAKRQGADGRADLLDVVASHGALALSQPAVRRAFLGSFGVTEGGLLGHGDLAPPNDLDGAASVVDGAIEVPWRRDELDESPALGAAHVLVAADVQGQLVALAFRELDDRLLLDPYQVAVPRLAEPVLRGVTRVAPGAPVGAPAEMSIERNGEGALIVVRARARRDEAAKELRLVRDPTTKAVTPFRER